MSGFNACWVPGSDHASIATEAKVVDMLKKEKGIEKIQLTTGRSSSHTHLSGKRNMEVSFIHQIEKAWMFVDWNRCFIYHGSGIISCSHKSLC
jgi:valyl-tRNA synthetase